MASRTFSLAGSAASAFTSLASHLSHAYVGSQAFIR